MTESSSQRTVSTEEIPDKQPCFVNAITSAIPAGILGWFFGLVPSMVRNRSLSLTKTWLSDAALSGQNLAKFSATYALSHCILTRVRQIDDAINRGAAGCATGLVIGFSGGPAAALQSCVGIGLISSILDLGGGSSEQAALASSSPSWRRRSCCAGCASSSNPSCQSQASAHSHGELTREVGHAHDHHDHLHDHHELVHGQDGKGLLHSAALHQEHSLQKMLQRYGTEALSVDLIGMKQQLALPPVMWLGSVCALGSTASCNYFDSMP
ncbi:hypothetical protein CEUSTIGMA_g11181.t1 [Chlamydomonas eustigma]|uniref:Uncharacterized protein n=1 Tax=Chlamydomonas eustigma TaxID=1157962 RepID=A0A250XL48_9CHLO|nr:hypothetical protein CEUSTIGMA_g11181.t1 [Chlamydomonas eustigma]|eukprot:GAX83756.1 hypothetical protein CEUSTIGMA_g11181.t1 [Chlamydomonas eustigma]